MTRQAATTNKKIDARPHKITKPSPAKLEQNCGQNDRRIREISDAAYFIALERGFDGGDPVNDWLVAEALVDGNAYRPEGYGATANSLAV